VRGMVDGLASPHPLGEALPGVYLDDEFTQRFTGALDPVLAPVFSVLDNLASYLDPTLTPADFVDWLAGWLGVPLGPHMPVERRREALARIVAIYGRRGTVQGLTDELELLTGGTVDVQDNGGTTWSSTPGTPLPGRPQPRVAIRVQVDDPGRVDTARVVAAVAAAKPANVPHAVQVTGR
jgi:phage tail-like protein